MITNMKEPYRLELDLIWEYSNRVTHDPGVYCFSQKLPHVILLRDSMTQHIMTEYLIN